MTTRLLARATFADGAELAPAFAQLDAEMLTKAIAERGAALVAVSGGTTPQRYFGRCRQGPIDWSRVSVTLVDERRVPDDHPRFNARLARRTAASTPPRRRNSFRSPTFRLTAEQKLGAARARVAACRCRPSRRPGHGRRRPHRVMVSRRRRPGRGDGFGRARPGRADVARPAPASRASR